MIGYSLLVSLKVRHCFNPQKQTWWAVKTSRADFGTERSTLRRRSKHLTWPLNTEWISKIKYYTHLLLLAEKQTPQHLKLRLFCTLFVAQSRPSLVRRLTPKSSWRHSCSGKCDHPVFRVSESAELWPHAGNLEESIYERIHEMAISFEYSTSVRPWVNLSQTVPALDPLEGN